MRTPADAPPKPRVLHVASGGFSGATQIALDLVRSSTHCESLLVLRRKRRTPLQRVEALQHERVPVRLVPGWSHLATIWALRALILQWKPDWVVGHGFPEHLLARWAGHWAKPSIRLVQVEHNVRERYTPWKRWQARQLAPYTHRFIGVSEAVAHTLRAHGVPPERVHAIPNGIALGAYARSEAHPWEARESAILMAARFGAQKDHLTLIRALPLLAQRHGLHPPLRLAGGGSERHRAQAQQLVQQLGLGQQVEFLGHCSDLPQRLQQHRVAALSTHFEGLPLVLAEALAAGCAVVGSDVPGVREVLQPTHAPATGALACAQDPSDWADRLAEALTGQADWKTRREWGRAYAREHLSLHRMVADYEALWA